MTRKLHWGALALCVALICLPRLATAQTLEKSRLAELELDFAAVKAVPLRPGAERLMRLDTLPGDRLKLHLPFHPNRLTWMISDGASVSRGQEIARITGPELEHWLLEVQLLRERFADARSRYERNRPLYEQRSLSAEQWQSIVRYYHALRLEQQHTSHILEWLRPDATGAETHDGGAAVLAATDGLIIFGADPEQAQGPDPLLAEIIDPHSLRLVVELAQDSLDSLVALRGAGCELKIAHAESRVNGLSRRFWSEPAEGCLTLRPGLRLSGVPLYRFDGYAVPREALLGLGGLSYVAIEDSSGLEIVQVRVRGEDAQNYYVTADESLNGTRVLVRSTSAVQGLIMGLGEE